MESWNCPHSLSKSQKPSLKPRNKSEKTKKRTGSENDQTGNPPTGSKSTSSFSSCAAARPSGVTSSSPYSPIAHSATWIRPSCHERVTTMRQMTALSHRTHLIQSRALEFGVELVHRISVQRLAARDQADEVGDHRVTRVVAGLRHVTPWRGLVTSRSRGPTVASTEMAVSMCQRLLGAKRSATRQIFSVRSALNSLSPAPR